MLKGDDFFSVCCCCLYYLFVVFHQLLLLNLFSLHQMNVNHIILVKILHWEKIFVFLQAITEHILKFVFALF